MAEHLLGLPLKHKHSGLKGIGESDHHRKWYLADEGAWISRFPHLIYGSWTRENAGNPIIGVHGSWISAEDATWIWDNTEKVFYIWYHGVIGTLYGIGLCKFDPATLTVTYLNNDEMVITPPAGYNIVRYPSVIYDADDGKYHMATMMRDTSSVWQGIFHWYSTDKINWTLDPTTAIVSDHFTPSWVRLGDAVYLVGSTIATPRTMGCFLGMGSTRYTSFTAGPNPILQVGEATEWDGDYVANPAIYWCFGVFYLIYSGKKGATKYRGGLAVSPNGWSYSKYGDNLWNPNLELGPTGKFDDNGVAIRCINRVEDKFHALYGGHDGQKWQLGYLTLE